MITLRTIEFMDICPSSGILNSYRTGRFGNWICFRLQVRGVTYYAEVSSLAKGLSRIGDSPHFQTEIEYFLVIWNSSRWMSRNPAILFVLNA
jgi:hypothetical protein